MGRHDAPSLASMEAGTFPPTCFLPIGRKDNEAEALKMAKSKAETPWVHVATWRRVIPTRNIALYQHMNRHKPLLHFSYSIVFFYLLSQSRLFYVVQWLSLPFLRAEKHQGGLECFLLTRLKYFNVLCLNISKLSVAIEMTKI